VPVLRREPIWKAGGFGASAQPGGVDLDESYRLVNLAELDADTADRERTFADVRMAWSPEGLALNVRVEGKTQPPWCREGRLEDSDGLQVWIDTRATLNIHRASRYCHRYAFLPAGGGQRQDEPLADQLLINRARENARPVRPRELQVASRVSKTGYWLAGFVPTVALGGYDPHQYRQLGFTYAVFDRELGMQTFATGPGFPFDEDPTCWAALELVDSLSETATGPQRQKK
jgi:hypothetical protein